MGFHLAVQGLSVYAEHPGCAASIPLVKGEAFFNDAFFKFGDAFLQGHPVIGGRGRAWSLLFAEESDKIELPDGQVTLQNIL